MITVECPKCRGNLHVGQEVDKIFCMYCRAEVTVNKPESSGTATSESLIKRGFLVVEYRDWEKALEVFDQAANIDPENAQIYLGMLLAELRIEKEQWLDLHDTPLSQYSNYSKAIRFADVDLKQRLEAYNETITKRLEENSKRLEEQERAEKDDISIQLESNVDPLLEQKANEEEKELDARAAEQTGCLIPLIKSIIYTAITLDIIVNIIFFFDQHSSFQLFFLNAYIFRNWSRLSPPWYIIAFIVIVWFVVGSVILANAVDKTKASMKEDQKFD